MSYDVKNMLRARGLKKLPIFGEDEYEKEIFDFNSILPMPEELEIESGGITGEAMEAAMRKLSLYKRMSDKPAPIASHLEKKGLEYVRNTILYGYPTWYEWRIANWGTKHNSYDLKIIDENTILFTTAVNEPKQVIAELAKRYPMLTIEHWWSGEEPGCYTGHLEYNAENTGHDVADESQEAFDIFVRLWGDTGCVIKDKGCWRRRRCDECDRC